VDSHTHNPPQRRLTPGPNPSIDCTQHEREGVEEHKPRNSEGRKTQKDQLPLQHTPADCTPEPSPHVDCTQHEHVGDRAQLEVSSELKETTVLNPQGTHRPSTSTSTAVTIERSDSNPDCLFTSDGLVHSVASMAFDVATSLETEPNITDIINSVKGTPKADIEAITQDMEKLTLTTLRTASVVTASVPISKVILVDRKAEATECLYDSGASYSCLNEERFKSYQSSWGLKLLPPSGRTPRFQVATGEISLPIGRTRVAMYFKGRRDPYYHNFWVTKNLSFDIIIGCDFFARTGGILNFGTSTIELPRLPGARPIPFKIAERASTNRGATTALVNTEELVMAPGKSYQLTLAPIGDTFRAGSMTGIISRHGKGERVCSLIADTLNEISAGLVLSEIANMSTQPTRVPKGTVLASFTPITMAKSMDEVMQGDSVLQMTYPSEMIEADQSTASAHTQCPKASCETPASYRPRQSDRKEQLSYINVMFLDDAEQEQEDSPLNHLGIPADLDLKAAAEVLSEKDFTKLINLVEEYSDIFARYYKAPPPTDMGEMEIDLVDGAVPFAAPVRRFSPAMRTILLEHVDKLEKEGVIRKCKSPWNAQVLLIPKKASKGEFRCCLNYKALNAQTKNVAANLPFIQDMLDVLDGAKFFSSFDMMSGYHALPLREKDQILTAFYVPGRGQYCWRRSAMGLKTSQSFYCKLTAEMMEGLLYKSALGFSDDILCYSKTSGDHIGHIRQIFERIRKFNLRLKAKKVELFKSKVVWCGSVISEEGITADPQKTEAISKMGNFKTLKQLRSFIGSASYLRKFIPRFTELTHPLRSLLKKGCFRRTFNPAQTKAIAALKHALTSAPCLAHPRWDREFMIFADASTVGIGAALMQKDDNGDLRAVAYLSKALTEVQQGYAIHELECLSIIWACTTWHPYIFDKKVTVFTDSQAAMWLLKPHSKHQGRLLRWSLQLSQYDLDVQYRAGAIHHLPDLLSRVMSEGKSQAPNISPVDLCELSEFVRQATCTCAEKQGNSTDFPCPIHKSALTTAKISAFTRSAAKRQKQHAAQEAKKQTRQTHHVVNTQPKTRKGKEDCTQHDSGPNQTKSESQEREQQAKVQKTMLTESDSEMSESSDSEPGEMAHDQDITTTTPNDSEPPLFKIINPATGGEKWSDLYPNDEFDAAALALRPELILFTKATARALLIKEQATDPKCMEIRKKLSVNTCEQACSPCLHASACIARHWLVKQNTLFRSTTSRRPIHEKATARRVREEFKAVSCTEEEHCSNKCVHHRWCLKEERVHRRLFKLVVPAKLVTSILYYYHGAAFSGHLGRSKTTRNISRNLWWKGIVSQTRRWIAACLPCRQRKSCRKENGVKPGVLTMARYAFQYIVIDFSGPYPTSKRSNRWILGIYCPFSKYPICIPLPSRKADVLVRALLENVIQYFSAPRFIVTDNGQELIGKTMKSFCAVFGITQIRTHPYTPRMNPFIERFWRFLTACMTILTSRFKDTWDDMLPLICLRYRTAVNDSTGYSPFHVVFGRDPELDTDGVFSDQPPPACKSEYMAELRAALDTIHTNVRNASEQAAQKNRARRLLKYKPVSYNVGDFCLVWSPKAAETMPDGFSVKPKLMDRWSLPRRIAAKGSRADNYVIIDGMGIPQNVRADSMIPYSFFTDGKPSVPERRKFTAEERKRLRRDPQAYLPPILRPGAMAAFPLTIENEQAFGIGRVTGKIDSSETFNLHWFSNEGEDIYGSFRPVWLRNDDSWYCRNKPEHHTHRPMMTSDCYGGQITQDNIGDSGFELLMDGKIPFEALRNISENPNFDWKLPREFTDKPDTDMVAVR